MKMRNALGWFLHSLVERVGRGTGLVLTILTSEVLEVLWTDNTIYTSGNCDQYYCLMIMTLIGGRDINR